MYLINVRFCYILYEECITFCCSDFYALKLPMLGLKTLVIAFICDDNLSGEYCKHKMRSSQ
jgi:hypothetical protein